jgi:hypothetical protein
MMMRSEDGTNEKTPPFIKGRGLPCDRRLRYLLDRLDALSGFNFALLPELLVET